MSEVTAQQITEYVRSEAEKGLRTVVIVTEDGYSISYLRDDLKKSYTEETFGDVVDTFRLENPFFDPEVEDQPVGERRALLHYHENACVLQLPYSESETILLSVSQEAGRDLVGFIETCRQIISDKK